jgi:hypothetical protein
MTFRTYLARTGVGAIALLAAGGLAIVGSPAYAAADQADLTIVPVSGQLAKGVKEAKAKPFKFTVFNSGPSAAKNVVVTVDVRGLAPKKVGWVMPAGCTAATGGYTCKLGDLADDTSGEFGVPLFSVGKKGAGGHLKVTVSSDTPDPNLDQNSESPDVTVTEPGYDLTAWSQDVYADTVIDGDDVDEPNLTPVAPGATAALDWAIYNHGSRKAVGLFYGITLPVGVSFAALPASCVQVPVGTQATAYCEESDTSLKPGAFFTDTVRVKVAADQKKSVLTLGSIFAAGLNTAAADASTAKREGEAASPQQRKAFGEVDGNDNLANFEVFVGDVVAPTPTPSQSTAPGGGSSGGGGGSLPVTGVQAGLIGGVGLAVAIAGGLMFLLARRRRLVLVVPDDERSSR